MTSGPEQRPPLLPVDSAGVGLVAKFLRALGDPSRLRLLEFLLEEEHTIAECAAHLGLSQHRVSTHLACLADWEYVDVRRNGGHSHYRVIDSRVADLVRLARSLAVDIAAELVACERIDR